MLPSYLNPGAVKGKKKTVEAPKVQNKPSYLNWVRPSDNVGYDGLREAKVISQYDPPQTTTLTTKPSSKYSLDEWHKMSFFDKVKAGIQARKEGNYDYAPREELYQEEVNKRANSPVGAFSTGLINSASLGTLNVGAEKQARDMNTLNVVNEAKKQSPIASTVGEFAGYALPASAGTKLAKPLVKNIANPLVKRIAEGAIVGGSMTAAQEAYEGKPIGDIGKDTALNMALGGALDLGLYGVGKAIKIPSYLKNAKNNAVVNAINQKFGNELINKSDLQNIKSAKGMTARVNGKLVSEEVKPSNPLIEPLNAQMGIATNKIAPTKNRRFIENSVLNSEVAPTGMKSKFEKNMPEYEPITNKETWQKAQSKVDKDLQSSLNEFIGKSEVKSADDTALGQALINKAVQEGRISDANALSINLAEKLTRAGQTVQAARIFKRLSPEGMLQYANKVIQNANEKLPAKQKIKISDDVAKKIVDDMQEISKMPEGQAKTEATQVVLKNIANEIPSSLFKKVDTLQTMAQLLNPKTSIRNILGNAGMQLNENISNTIGTGLDKVVSLATGKRTVGLPSLKTQALGYKEGFQNGIRQTKLGILGDNTQFDLPNGQVFRNKGIGKALNGGQKVLDYMLRVPDEAAKTSIYNDSLRSQMKLAKVDVPTEEMKLIAENDAKYGTFQDDNAVSNAFSAIKRAMNGGKEFGIGSMLLKYPKTPANILMRAIDYSPAGFFKATYRLAEPLINGNEFNQRDFVKATSRALVGTGNLIGTGYILNKLGIITGKSNTDTDTANMQRQIGLGDYKINLSALKRFVASGFNPNSAKIQKGDKLTNYDWLQPSSIGLAIGANAADKTKNGTNLFTTIVDSVNSGMNTLAQQPLISGLTTALGQKDIAKGITSTIKGVPASMVPTVFKQVAQLIDNTSRNTYDPGWEKQGINMIKSKLPGLTTTLQPRIDSLGNEQKAYENNSLVNVFLNPAFNTTYNPKPAAKLPLDIFNNTGNTIAMPRQTPTYIINKGQRINLTPKEVTDYQRSVGKRTAIAIEGLGNIPADDKAAKKIQSIMTKIQAEERNKILINRGIPVKK